jgi:hypothetical protein
LLIVAPGTAHAGPIVAGDVIVLTNGLGLTVGGGFNMTKVGSAESFITFSLQRSEFISFNTPYLVNTVTNYADDAGGNDPISAKTAWLYTQVRLDPSAIGYDGTRREAKALQRAIWLLEKEITLNDLTIAQQNGALRYIDLAKEAKAGGYSGIGNVRVANLNTLNGEAAQDQLVLVPEPSTLALLVPGLLALGAFRPRRTVRQ